MIPLAEPHLPRGSTRVATLTNARHDVNTRNDTFLDRASLPLPLTDLSQPTSCSPLRPFPKADARIDQPGHGPQHLVRFDHLPTHSNDIASIPMIHIPCSATFALPLSLIAASLLAADPLPSWNETDSKHAVIAFVDRVTRPDSPDFVPEPERIAVFDNDGTLWSEQPIYTQVLFLIHRIRALAPQHPEWTTKEPFASLLEGDWKGVAATGEAGFAELMAATHSGMSTDAFSALVSDWLATAKHPQTGRPFTEMVYQPMLELLAYLRANGFKNFIVSGGGVEFMRPWTERVYGIPPEQVIGSTGGLKFEIRDGQPTLMKLPTLVLNDDKDGKPVGIQRHIGRRPIAAFGNSDGDLQMLQWTASGPGPRFCLFVHHTDAEREWAYDREGHVGRLDQGLAEAAAQGWTVVNMKEDWRTVFSAAVGD